MAAAYHNLDPDKSKLNQIYKYPNQNEKASAV
jgi:hypothetical protein